MIYKRPRVKECLHSLTDAKQLPTCKPIIGNVIVNRDTFEVRFIRDAGYKHTLPLKGLFEYIDTELWKSFYLSGTATKVRKYMQTRDLGRG